MPRAFFGKIFVLTIVIGLSKHGTITNTETLCHEDIGGEWRCSSNILDLGVGWR
jgi:hypothetical protein